VIKNKILWGDVDKKERGRAVRTLGLSISSQKKTPEERLASGKEKGEKRSRPCSFRKGETFGKN